MKEVVLLLVSCCNFTFPGIPLNERGLWNYKIVLKYILVYLHVWRCLKQIVKVIGYKPNTTIRGSWLILEEVSWLFSFHSRSECYWYRENNILASSRYSIAWMGLLYSCFCDEPSLQKGMMNSWVKVVLLEYWDCVVCKLKKTCHKKTCLQHLQNSQSWNSDLAGYEQSLRCCLSYQWDQ